MDISKLLRENPPRMLRVVSREDSYWVKDGQRMTSNEVQLEWWRPRLTAYLKEAFDRNLDWPKALQYASDGCTQENNHHQFLSDAIPDISSVLSQLEDGAESNWQRWQDPAED